MHQKAYEENQTDKKFDKNITGPVFPKIVQSILKQ